MTKLNSKRISALFAASMVALGCASMALSTATALGQNGNDKKKAQPAAGGKDRVILRDGRVLEGRILSETDTQIEFELVVAGIVGTRTIERTDILEVKKAPKGDEPKTPGGKPKADPREVPKASAVAASAGTKVYLVPLTGEFERDVALTPLKRVLEDAKRNQPDILVFKVDCDFKKYGQEKPDWMPELGSFDQLELARQIDPLITDAIREDPEWKVKPRLVFWIRKALGGIAFVPFLSNELYYTSDAKHGGIGYLDYVFDGIGDDVVREKQRSLRLARAEGIALKGGHPAEIMEAMARVDYVLSVNFVGGRPEFHEDTSGEVLLTDDGNLEAGRRDTTDDMLRFTGNDVLTLTAGMAQRLGMSKGTADTEDELFEKMGIGRNNPTKVGRGQAILEEWSKAVTEAEYSIKRLWRELDRVEVREPGGWTERTQARGRQKAILKDILAYLEKYKEAINPYQLEMMPEDMITRVKLLIDQIEQQQRRDKDK